MSAFAGRYRRFCAAYGRSGLYGNDLFEQLGSICPLLLGSAYAEAIREVLIAFEWAQAHLDEDSDVRDAGEARRRSESEPLSWLFFPLSHQSVAPSFLMKFIGYEATLAR